MKYADIMGKQKERNHKINNCQLLLQDYDYKLENDINGKASPWDELQKFWQTLSKLSRFLVQNPCCNYAWPLKLTEAILKNPMTKPLPFLSRWSPAGHNFRGQQDLGASKDLGASCTALLSPNTSFFLMHSLSEPKYFVSLIALYNVILMLLESVLLAGRSGSGEEGISGLVTGQSWEFLFLSGGKLPFMAILFSGTVSDTEEDM